MRLLALLPLLALPAHAQGPAPTPGEIAPPPPLAVEAAAYVYAAANVCGFRIDPEAFDRLLRQRGSDAATLRLQGPFGSRIRTRFVMLTNGMAGDRNNACTVVWRELGAEGTLQAGVVQEAKAP
jgi:hypothetical protein